MLLGTISEYYTYNITSSLIITYTANENLIDV